MKGLGRVPMQARVLAVVGVFWLLAWLSGVHGVDDSAEYLYATSLLLAIGLYGSTFGIDTRLANEHRGLILAAITVGVMVKALLIGGVLLLATRNPLFLILGVAVAQIDPLSVAAIMGDKRMSPRTKTILRAWASFDDPVTVILVVYASAIAIGSFGLGERAGAAPGSGSDNGLLAYGVDLAANLGLAGLIYIAWHALAHRRWLRMAVLALLAVVAVWQFLMLAVAIAGLFVRPRQIEPLVARVTTAALVVAGALLGMLLVDGVNLVHGLYLGLMAFGAQVIVGFALTRRLPVIERMHLAFAQQNGITAIILALRLEAQFVGVVAVIAPAIVVTNLTHVVANWILDRRHTRRAASVPARAWPPT